MILPLFVSLIEIRLLPSMKVNVLERMINLLLLLCHLSQLCTFLHARHVAAARIQFAIVVNFGEDEVPTLLIKRSIILVIERDLTLLMPLHCVRKVEVDGVLQVLDLNHLCNG